ASEYQPKWLSNSISILPVMDVAAPNNDIVATDPRNPDLLNLFAGAISGIRLISLRIINTPTKTPKIIDAAYAISPTSAEAVPNTAISATTMMAVPSGWISISGI